MPDRVELQSIAPQREADSMPRWIFWVELAWLIALIATFAAYHLSGDVRSALPDTLGARIPLEVPWFGAIGGCLISLTGITKHNRDWDKSFNYWHPIRPLMSALAGSVGCVLLIVITDLATKGTAQPPDPLFYAAVAFVFGYAETSFRALIVRLADVVLPQKARTDE